MLTLVGFSIAGCGSSESPALVIAVTRPIYLTTETFHLIDETIGKNRSVEWVILKSDDDLANLSNRRNPVDLLLEVISKDLVAENWDKLAAEEDWGKYYEDWVRRLGSFRPEGFANSDDYFRPERVVLIQGGRHPDRARQVMEALEKKAWAERSSGRADTETLADGLLADLLHAVSVEAIDELRESKAALARHGHPARAEGSLGERPPWPPASVTRLMDQPGGEALVETLAEQICPDPEARAWLLESWSKPRRFIDMSLLNEVAGATDGNLAREPRFRAWLRVEWVAWNRQLYRRVARLAGGYIPS